jgi:hypothetical protein
MTGQNAGELIGQLRDFRLRSGAAARLVALGEEAVGPLLAAVDGEGNEGARWAILNCLGQLRAPEAVPALAAHLERDAFHTVAHDGLACIVGHDLGPLPGPWLRWAAARGESGPAAAPQDLPDAELVEQAAEGSGATLSEEAAGRYVVEVPMAGGRSRKVWVVFGQSDHEGSPVVIVFANCGAARAEVYEAALRLNLKMPYGAVALRDVAGEPQFVMFNTILRAALTPVELHKSIFAVGQRSDHVERHLGE